MKKFLVAILTTGLLFTGCSDENPETVNETKKPVEKIENL